MKTLGLHGACSVAGLADQLAVSGETIRRDIKLMANRGLVERVHGGVILPDLFHEPAFQKRLGRNAEAKKAIARTAASQVPSGDSLMMDTGSTTAYVARALTGHSDLMVVTNCSDIAHTLAGNSRNKIYLAGGEFRADDSAVFGASAIGFVKQFRVGTAILSIAAIDPSAGFMDFHLSEADFSRAVIQQAGRVIVVADHTKFAAQAPVKVCDFSAVDTLVTDRPPPPPVAERRGREVLILTAGLRGASKLIRDGVEVRSYGSFLDWVADDCFTESPCPFDAPEWTAAVMTTGVPCNSSGKLGWAGMLQNRQLDDISSGASAMKSRQRRMMSPAPSVRG